MTSLLNIPPVWLALGIVAAWIQGRYLPMPPALDGGVWTTLSSLLIWGGAVLILLAAFAFWRARTTIIPHRTPERLITSGIYAYSRNPIYLGDVLILTGFVIHFDAWPSLMLVPLFIWWGNRAFIQPEEDRMRVKFKAEFTRYEQNVRRWI